MEVRLLGPLEVVAGTRPVALARGRARSLLALLALHPGEVVATERLVDALWGETPPPTATTALHGLVSSLRKRLEPERGDGEVPRILQTRPPGYLLAVEREQVDANRFRSLVEQALGTPAPQRAARLRAALDLWRGSALADLAYEPFAQTPIAALEELRLTALEERIDADLATGRHAEVVAELRELVAAHPLRERLHGHLMLALYRCGRQAHALEAYQDARGALVDELGIEPGTALMQLEQAILRQAPSLDLVARPPRSEAAAEAAEDAPPGDPLPWLPSGRKLTTVVFIDLAPSSPGPEGSDPEVRGQEIAGCVEAAREVLTRHGGNVRGFIGDVVVAVFGVPTAHEDDALRAVRAVSELRRVLADRNRDRARVGGTQLVARVGVDTGEVIVRGPGAGDAAASGEAVKMAARLQQAATDGEVLLGETTRRLAGDAVAVERIGDRVLDGSGRATSAWRLVDLAPEPSGRRPDLDTPLVGRSAELARLRAAFDRALGEQRATRVTVVGEAGIGKSRLAVELAARLGDEARVLTGRCPAYGEGITFWPLREMVLQAAGDHRREAIRDLLEGAPDAESTATQVAAATGLTEGTASPDLLFPAVRRLLEALAVRQPLMLVFDDVHWAQPALLELVEYLAGTARAPLLLVCLARPELGDQSPSWTTERNGVAPLALEPLAPHDSEQLVADLLAGRSVPAGTRERVVELAQGNPLFLEQLVAALGDDRDVSVPPSLQALLAARLDRLGPAERDLARCASVLGADFSTAALTALLPPQAFPFVDRHLRALQRKQLVRRSSASLLGEPAFVFRHVLIQDAAYRSTSRRDRAGLHERFAAWLEDKAGARLLEHEEVVAYHLEQAHEQRSQLGLLDAHTNELAIGAGERLANTGLRAYARFDAAAAVNLLSRARSLLPADHARRWEATEPLPEMLQVLGRHRDAGSVLTELLGAARRDGDRHREQRLRLEQARINLITGPDPTSLNAIRRDTEHARKVLASHGDRAGLALAAYVAGLVHLRRGELSEMEAVARRGLADAERSGNPREEAAMRWWVALALTEGPTPVTDCVSECDRLVQWRGGHHPGVLAELARLRAMQGAGARGRELMIRARTLFVERVRGRRPLMFTAQRRAEVELLAGGDLAMVQDELQAALDIALDMGEPDPAAQLTAQLSRVQCEQGRVEEAARLASLSLERAPAESVTAQTLAHAAMARALAAGNAPEAARFGRAAVGLAPTAMPNLAAGAHLDLATVLRVAGQHNQARSAARTAASLFHRKGNMVDARRARTLAGDGAPRGGRPPTAPSGAAGRMLRDHDGRSRR